VNIFVLDDNPFSAAEMMMDKHVVKMPTESLQMVSTIMEMNGFNSPFKSVMANHPCTIWARESGKNFNWLVDHTIGLCKEYTNRYHRVHKVELLLNEFKYDIEEVSALLSNKGLTEFAQAMPDEYKNDDAVLAYRTYYLEDKWRIASWKFGAPNWWPKDHIKKKTKEWYNFLESENKRIRGIKNE
tara:strand:- start:678 stop:1232 length:555 start_codon:yes stop_codon:yes gene_type:complete